MTCKECLDSLNAFVDGELAADEAAAVRDHLATCDDCAAQHTRLVEGTMRLKGALMRYEAPDVLKARLRASLSKTDPEVVEPARLTQRPRFVRWSNAVAAAAIVAVLSSVATLSFANRQSDADAIQSELLASHIRSLMPGHLTDVASNDQHNVKPWFNGRVDISPNVPRLDSLGFPLVGGRIDYINGRSVPVIVYTRRQHVINVFAWPSNTVGDKTVTSSSHGYNLIRVPVNGEEMWIVSDLNRNELDTFARLLAGRG